jgi:hypothetical protein
MKNIQKKENEKLAFYGPKFAFLQICLLCKIKFLVPIVSFAPHPPPRRGISQVTRVAVRTSALQVSLAFNRKMRNYEQGKSSVITCSTCERLSFGN